MKVVYDENNPPSHIEREIIVRFDPNVVRLRNIDKPAFQAGHLSDFVNDSTSERVAQMLGYSADNIEAFKIFGAMTSADTLSISRTGDTIRLDDHWASFVLQLPLGAKEQIACDRLNTLFPLVRYAHPNWVAEVQGTGQPTGIPNDSFYAAQQASLHATAQYPNGHINTEQAWIYQTGKNYVKVGVFDTGIDAAHPDLGNGSVFSSVVTAGRDYLTNSPRFFIQDSYGHGTAVAGIIAAKRNDATGIAGIAGGNYGSSPTQSGVQLVDLKIGNGTISTSAAISAIVEGATFSSAASGYGFGLQVMNHSWGGPQGSEALKSAVRTAYRNGCVFVASRGNGPPQSASATAANYPASYDDDWVISVGASGTDGQHKTQNNANSSGNNDDYESSYGGGVDLIAPGTTALVYTTRSQVGSWGSGLYTDFNGTSAAAPHVSGVAALVLSNQNDPNNPQNNLAGEDVQHLLKRTANDRVQTRTGAVPGYDDLTGWGLLDAGKAVYQSRPAIYHFGHAGFTNPSNSTSLAQANTPIILPNNYVGNGATLSAGLYRADVWKVAVGVPVRYPHGPIMSANDQVLDVWPRNSTSTLWGPANPLVTEPGVRVTSWDQNSATVEGYTYHILTNVLGQRVDKWIPVNIIGNSRLDVTFYTYNRQLDLNVSSQRPATTNATAGFASIAYPNPTSNEVSLSYENPPTGGELTVEILSSTGIRVRQQHFPASGIVGERTVQLPVRELAAGLYTYRLVTEQGVSVGKFIKQQ